MAVETTPQAHVFSLRTPLLSDGRSMDLLAQTDALRIWSKVYAEGGENALHCHTQQDHAFIILEGEAAFHDQHDNVTLVKKHEGIMLPKGAYYWFEARGDRNLVMVRVAAMLEIKAGDDRLDIDGKPLPGYAPENKGRPPVPIPGKFFGD